MNKTLLILFLVLLASCGPSADEIRQAEMEQQRIKKEASEKIAQENAYRIAAVTCSIMGATRNMDAAVRIREMNEAREKIGGEPFLRGDYIIKEALEWGLCQKLVLNESYDEILQSLKDAKSEREIIAEEEARIAAVRQAEEARIAAVRQAEEEKIASVKRVEEARIALLKEAKEERAAISQYRDAANKELSNYRFYTEDPQGYGDGLHFYPDERNIYLKFAYSAVSGITSKFTGVVLAIESIAIDFTDPKLPGFVLNDLEISIKDLSKGVPRYEQLNFANQTPLSREQRELFLSKFGTGKYDRVYPSKSEFTVTMKVRGLETSSPEPFDFECRHFEVLKELCGGISDNGRAYFKTPIEITF